MVFYADEAKARLEAGNTTGALEILDLADERGVGNDFTHSIRASVLQKTAPESAAALRMEHINAGSRNAAFYSDEAKARLEAGNTTGALEILDLADERGVGDDFTLSIRASVLQKTAPESAAALRMEHINAGSRNAALYNDEAKG
ncbi:hypothetical protein [Vogesella indigofera]|uniref:hypothetical protein n=1 Tax=Vogesella indigofera TaxID=45465 RepID=UPI00234F1B64|nr:hypothetical protein [Vogesella indigofera]MDC7696216.1 hypothetical protein [Vogesella indigofera]